MSTLKLTIPVSADSFDKLGSVMAQESLGDILKALVVLQAAKLEEITEGELDGLHSGPCAALELAALQEALTVFLPIPAPEYYVCDDAGVIYATGDDLQSAYAAFRAEYLHSRASVPAKLECLTATEHAARWPVQS